MGNNTGWINPHAQTNNAEENKLDERAKALKKWTAKGGGATGEASWKNVRASWDALAKNKGNAYADKKYGKNATAEQKAYAQKMLGDAGDEELYRQSAAFAKAKAYGTSKLDARQRLTKEDLTLIQRQANSEARGADRSVFSSLAADHGFSRDQHHVGNQLAARAMGTAPSAAGLEAQYARGQAMRGMQAASVGGGLAARAAMLGSVDQGIGLAAQAGQARGAEIGAAQSQLGGQLRGMQAMSLGREQLGTQHMLAARAMSDRDTSLAANNETAIRMTNLENQEQMRQQMLRTQLIRLGQQDATAAQNMQRQGMLMNTAATAGTALAGAGIDAWKNAGKK